MTQEERREALLAERPDAEVVLADERRRTAEKIAQLLGVMWAEIEPSTSYREGLRDGLVRAQGRIAREIGGSDE